MDGIKIGIGRVSSKDQNEQRQIEAFLAEGIDPRYIFIDKVTGNGGHIDDRKEYKKARIIARKGDTIYLDALDRLGRNTREIEQEWRYFTEEVGCYMVVMSMELLDTRPKNGNTGVNELIAKIALSIFAWMAQQETEERRRRQRAGIDIAKREGKYKGRKPVDVDKYEFATLRKEVLAGDRTASSAIRKLGISRTTFYKLVHEFDTKTGRFKE